MQELIKLLRQSECRLKKNFQMQRISEGSEFIKRSRDNEGTVSEVGWPPDRPGRVDSFCGLVANFYNLKTNKIPAGRLAPEDWLGRYRATTAVGIFA